MASDKRDRYTLLAKKWLEGSLTKEEEQEFNAWYDEDQEGVVDMDTHGAQDEGQLKKKLFQQIQQRADIQPDKPVEEERSLEDISDKDDVRPNYLWRHILIKVAAAVIIILGIIAVFLSALHQQQNAPIETFDNTVRKNDVLPGTEKAILTLPDGTKMLIDSASSGVLATQSSYCIIAVAGGLTYQPIAKLSPFSNTITYNEPEDSIQTDPDKRQVALQNILATPRGGRYHLTLPDGTKVWMNAASSITFPTNFVGRERRVIMAGEAYFEVAKDPLKPFKVTVNQMEIAVLGTHFNVNAYGDESSLNTTLLEGAVTVRDLNNDHAIKIKPGQQAKLYRSDEIKVIAANTVQSVAWKNGLFQFEGADLHALLNEVSRWYNINIEWKGAGSKDRFTGTIPRNLKLSELLSVLDYANVRFSLKDKKLTVYT